MEKKAIQEDSYPSKHRKGSSLELTMSTSVCWDFGFHKGPSHRKAHVTMAMEISGCISSLSPLTNKSVKSDADKKGFPTPLCTKQFRIASNHNEYKTTSEEKQSSKNHHNSDFYSTVKLKGKVFFSLQGKCSKRKLSKNIVPQKYSQ